LTINTVTDGVNTYTVGGIPNDTYTLHVSNVGPVNNTDWLKLTNTTVTISK